MNSTTPRSSRRSHRKKESPFVIFAGIVILALAWPFRKLKELGGGRTSVVVIVVSVIAVLGLLAVVDLLAERGRIHSRVSVNGVGVGYLKPREASAKLAQTTPQAHKLTLTHEGDSWTIDVAALRPRIDGRAAAHQAYLYTRSGNWFTQRWRRLIVWVAGADLVPPLAYDDPAVAAALKPVTKKVVRKPVAASVKIVGSKPIVREGVTGQAIDRPALDALLAQAALGDADVTAELPVRVAEPAVSTEQARAAAEQAAQMVSGPLTLRDKSTDWVLKPAELGQMIAFVKKGDGDTATLTPTFLSPVTNGYFDYLTESVGKPGQDASFKIVGTSVRVVPGKLGYGVVEGKTVANMEAAAAKSGSDREAEVVMGSAKPALSFAEAKAMGIKKRIMAYTTGVAGTTNRLDNVRLGAELLDDTLIAPGQVFSVNETTGERTAAKGFKMAPTIIAGKLEDSIGGGMCQVSTTVFNAAFEAGLQIVERHNHMLYISHYPLGRDATVSYGSYDFKFRNDTDHYILLKMTFTGYSLTASLYSAPLHRKVVSSTSSWSNFIPFSTQKKDDPTLAKGKTKVDTPGVSGQSITCYRKVYEGGKLLWDDVFKSVYSMVPQVVLVGTKPVASPSPTASPKATKSPTPAPTSTKKP